MIAEEPDIESETKNSTNKIDINENILDPVITDHESYILDPLSVIIKLAIIGHKPIGTKILISNKIVYLQEPGIFQGICRYYYKTSKTCIHFLYNPIQIACEQYLSDEYITKNPKIIDLFTCAQKGINNLCETYKSSAIIKICLNYFHVIIENYTTKTRNPNIFRKDSMSNFYDVTKTNPVWTDKFIKIVLDNIDFLLTNENPTSYVKSLESIMENIDKTI